MKRIRVGSSRGPYEIVIGSDLLRKTGQLLKPLSSASKVMIVTQSKVARFHLQPVHRSLEKHGFSVAVHRIPDGEMAKSGKVLFGIYHALTKAGFERRDWLLGLGGGVVGDLTGFAAATYLRGVSFVNLGTTLLAQVDSSIGGKTGINLPQGKNLVGAFYPPRLVVSDVAVLRTLPERQFRASLGEIVKYGIIRDAKLFAELEKNNEAILKKDPRELGRIVMASSQIKAEVVSRDEYETRGARMILNFGHTFAHGLEQALGYRTLFHGEAVAIGMSCAARLAVRMGLFSSSDERRFLRLLEQLRLPASLKGLKIRTADVLRAMSRDKKKKAGQLRFVLPTKIGSVVVMQNIPEPLLVKAMEEAGSF